MNVDVDTISAVASRISGVAALVFFVYAGYKRWIVWGYQLDEANARCERVEAECREYREVARDALVSTRRSLDVATVATQAKEGK